MDKFLAAKRQAIDRSAAEASPKKPKVDSDDSLSDLLRVPFEKLTDEGAFEAWFSITAHLLMNECVVFVNNQPHRFAELEFYVHCNAHQDPFPHKNADQTRPAAWYFHRNGASYRGGTYKGLDVACGGGKPGLVGGILIRSLEALGGSGALVNGPCKCVDHILQLCGASSVADFVDRQLKGELSCVAAHSPLRIARAGSMQLPVRPLQPSLRVGLQPSKPVDALLQLRMLLAPYRYVFADKRIAKGRVHLVAQLLRSGRPRSEIATLSHCTPAKLDELIKAFDTGRQVAAAKSPADVAHCYAGQKLENDADILRVLGEFVTASTKTALVE